MAGNRRLLSELTIHDGIVVYDLNGIARDSWDRLVITNTREARHGMEPEARAEGRVDLSGKPLQGAWPCVLPRRKR